MAQQVAQQSQLYFVGIGILRMPFHPHPLEVLNQSSVLFELVSNGIAEDLQPTAGIEEREKGPAHGVPRFSEIAAWGLRHAGRSEKQCPAHDQANGCGLLHESHVDDRPFCQDILGLHPPKAVYIILHFMASCNMDGVSFE